MILVDTGPLVALCDPRDSHHRRAVKHLQQLQTANLATCEAALTEACFHLPHRAQRERLRATLDEFDVAAMTGAAPGFWMDVFEWLVKYAEHEPDWTDGCIAVLCGRHEAAKVWTYDREFRTTWRRPNGTAIPMAITS